MAGRVSTKSNPTKARKRVEADDGSAAASSADGATLIRAKDGSAFARCDECKKDVPVALISMHSCSLEAKIKMNLEAQVVEKPAEAIKKKPAERKKATSREPNPKKAKTGKDSNKPKRPVTAFFLFLNDFRKEFKEANPDSKDVKRVAKEGGEKWRSMTDEEKKPYLDEAAERKAEYHKSLANNNAENEDDEVGSEKELDKEVAEQEVQDVSDEE